MAGTQTRSSGLFSGLVLLSVGTILLLHNYGHLDLSAFFSHWWPLLIIFWGVVKLYERTLGKRFGGGGGAITGSELLLVLAMFSLMGMVVMWDVGKEKLPISGDSYGFDLDVAPKAIPAKAPVLVHSVRGDISVRGSDEAQIRVTARKNVKTWSEEEAERIARPIAVEITQNGDSYEIHPAGFDQSDGRISVDLEISVPRRSPLTVRTDKGDVEVSDYGTDVTVANKNGNVDLHGTDGDVSVEMGKGDVKINDTKGDVKISGKGGEIEVNSADGSLTVDGDFYGPERADRVAKGVRMITARTDLTVSALAGHLEISSGNLDLIDAPGNLDLRTRDTAINVENPGGKVNIQNRNAQTTVRFMTAPKEDVSITNSSAGISLSLPGSASFEVQADCRNCDVESDFAGLGPVKSPGGDASMAGKFGSGRGVKITLKTSYANIELRRSAIPVPPRPGTPPKPPTPIPPAVEQ